MASCGALTYPARAQIPAAGWHICAAAQPRDGGRVHMLHQMAARTTTPIPWLLSFSFFPSITFLRAHTPGNCTTLTATCPPHQHLSSSKAHQGEKDASVGFQCCNPRIQTKPGSKGNLVGAVKNGMCTGVVKTSHEKKAQPCSCRKK